MANAPWFQGKDDPEAISLLMDSTVLMVAERKGGRFHLFFVTFAPFQTNSQAEDAQCIVRGLLSRSRKGKIPDMPVTSTSGENRAGLGVTAQELISFRVDMLRFARLQLRNAEAAEDMVQDAIEAALRGASSFAGQSSLKTWVFAILRNRIIDYIRQAGRTVSMSSLVDDGDGWQERLETLFNDRGRWNDGSRPAPWPEPEQSMQNREFWRVFEACLDHLPENTGRVFMMREFLGFDSQEICSHLGISISNCHVMLHRARLKLRDCMEKGWGRPGGARC